MSISTNDAAYADFGRERFNKVSGAKMAHILAHSGLTVLDVGCGPGAYLQALRQKGLQADGVEGNPIFAVQAAGTGSKIHELDLDEVGLLGLADNSYDTVFALDVIEHLHFPEKVLKEMVRVARKNILVSVPAETPVELSNQGFLYAAYLDPTHLRYYTPASLGAALQEAGLSHISVHPVFRVKPVLTNFFFPRWRPVLHILNRILEQFIIPQTDWSVLLGVGYKS